MDSHRLGSTRTLSGSCHECGKAMQEIWHTNRAKGKTSPDPAAVRIVSGPLLYTKRTGSLTKVQLFEGKRLL